MSHLSPANAITPPFVALLQCHVTVEVCGLCYEVERGNVSRSGTSWSGFLVPQGLNRNRNRSTFVPEVKKTGLDRKKTKNRG
jgi:hypothetical protein